LREWINRDGLTCLKIKLRGNDQAWDYERLIRVGDMSLELGVDSLSADFNCMVTDPDYVNQILDRLKSERRDILERILYVEQPFPYDLEKNQIEVSSVSSRKPLFLDESAHDWKFVALGRKLGWTGVALKTCKTQTGALLSLCWAKAHGMPLMVQDLTNPMLAQIPHVRLAAHAGTIMGVESNGMQFYPAASEPEERVHPGNFPQTRGKARPVDDPGARFWLPTCRGRANASRRPETIHNAREHAIFKSARRWFHENCDLRLRDCRFGRSDIAREAGARRHPF
jgi:L-alanine-DL-glutamate epimerase-like enolase superfamily enzyme